MVVSIFRSLFRAIAVLLCATVVAAAPAESSTACKNPIVRQEWRQIPPGQRQKFINAIKCTMNKPPQTSTNDVPGVRSRYDDFLATHIVSSDFVHFVGIFYPYHRMLLNLFEQTLHECGWSGGIPYWDWELDMPASDGNTAPFFNSPVFDEEFGFGGNGDYIPGSFDRPAENMIVNAPFDIPDRTGGGCINRGPFAGLQSNLGPSNLTDYNPHCVRRDFAPTSFFNMGGPAALSLALSQPDYGAFEKLTETQIHAAGHVGPGGLYGTMTDMWSSPGDPLFWLHHCNLDRTWWSWQNRDLNNRLSDISGPLVAFDYDNQADGNATLDTPFVIGQTVKTQAIARDVMHIQKGPLCYQYDTLY